MEVKYYECDRCGKRVEMSDTRYNMSIYRDVLSAYTSKSREFYDLCAECKAAFDEWMGNHGTH